MNLKIKYLLLFVPAFAIFCYPIINSGYYGDDSLNSFVGAMMSERNLSLLDQYILNFKAFLPGRFSVLQFYHWAFLLFTNLIFFKIYVCVMVLLALISTYLVIKAIVNTSTPFLAVIFSVLIGIQFREYGDSVLVFHAATSISLVFLNTSILLFIKFLKSNTRISIAGSIIFFTLACFSYELMYPFFMLYFPIAIVLGNTSIKRATKYLGLFLAPIVLLTLPNIFSRLLVAVPKDAPDPNYHKAYEFSLDIGAIFLTFCKEILASLPLSNLILNPFSSLSVNNLVMSSPNWALLLVVLLGLFSTIFYFSLKDIAEQPQVSEAKDPQRNQALLVLFALMLLVIPNGIIALSPKYQSEIIWGSGYVSLYFGYFGVSILISMVLHALIKRFRAAWIPIAISVVLGTAAVANFTANNKTVEVLNSFWKNPRTVAEEALRNGILTGIENHAAYIFLNNNYPWDVTSFIYKYSGIFLNQEQYAGAEGRFLGSKVNENFLISDGKPKGNSEFSPKAEKALSKFLKYQISGNYYFDMDDNKGVHYFDYYADSDSSGYALLADVRKVFLSGAHINGLASDRVRIYMRIPQHRGAYSSLSATFLGLDPSTLKPLKQITIQENQFKIISQGNGWKLFEIANDEKKYLIDVKSVRLNTSQKIYQTSWFPKSFSEKSELKFKVDPKSEILHVGFSAPFDNSHIAFDSVKLGKEFSIVLRARLDENAVLAPYAHMVGNHPGKNNFEGFVVQKKPLGKNVFDLHVGTGTAWKHVFDFPLQSDKDTFIALSVKNGKATTLIDGVTTTIDLGGDIHDSEMPLYIGNYIGKDRPFPGQVSELLITNTALPETTLAEFQKKSAGN